MSVLSVHHRLEGRSCVHLVLPFLVRIDKVSLYVGSGLQYLFSLFQSHDHKCRSVCVGGGAVFGHYGGRQDGVLHRITCVRVYGMCILFSIFVLEVTVISRSRDTEVRDVQYGLDFIVDIQ